MFRYFKIYICLDILDAIYNLFQVNLLCIDVKWMKSFNV